MSLLMTDMGIFFFAQLVFSTYLSVVLLNTSHNLRGEVTYIWNELRENVLIGISLLFFFK